MKIRQLGEALLNLPRHHGPTSPVDRSLTSFGSPDSIAGGLAVRVPLLRAPTLLVTFTILAVVQVAIFKSGMLDATFPARDWVAAPHTGFNAVGIRAFMFSFFVAFSIFATGSIKARFLFCLDLCFRYLLLLTIIDAGSVAMYAYTGRPLPVMGLQVIAGFIGIAVFSVVMIRRGAMPAPEAVTRGKQHQFRALVRLALTGSVAMAISIYAFLFPIRLIDQLRSVALLGGLGPGVILFLLVLFAELRVISIIDQKRLAKKDFCPPLTVIVPAHNEEHIISQTITHIDRAAAYYAAPVEVIIIDDGSVDRTYEVAADAISHCQAAAVRVVSQAGAGKSAALNRGVEEASYDFIVRIDADTLVSEDNLKLAMENFGDPTVGAVGGMPLPPGGGLFDPSRLVEVALKHGYYSPALSTIAALVGIPGMFVVYRAEALRKVGRFAEGMNGEDVDVSLRIAELGYRTVCDQRITYISEVPINFAHLREQRIRWFRSVFHVSARCHSLISAPTFNIRGKLVLPYMLLNTSRRAMAVPLIVFGILELVIDAGDRPPLHWQAIAAVLIGSPMLAAASAILVNKRPAWLLALPQYILFCTLRAWYTLEAMLSIPITSTSTRIQIGREPWPETPRKRRIEGAQS